jgi:quinol monooxygenase YgiN
MKPFLGLVFGAGILLAGMASSVDAADTPAPPPGLLDVMSFIEVAPAAQVPTEAVLKTYRDAARKEPGVVEADIYREVGTPSRFVTHEIWKDEASYDAHAKTAAAAALLTALKPVQYGPPDVHPHIAIFSAREGYPPASGRVLIVSHLDVTPPAVPALLDYLKPLDTGSAKEPGVVQFQILQQTAPHANHFRVFEIWASEKDWEAHNLAKHTQDFRDNLAPLLGTPYDQRKYTVLD